MNNACPNCGAVYNVTNRDVGRRLKCKMCSAPMLITEYGIEAETGSAPAPVLGTPVGHPDGLETGTEASPVRGRRSSRLTAQSLSSNGAVELFHRFSSPLSTLVFGFGAFLVIFHLFMPLIGDAKIRGRQANVEEERMTYEDDVEAVNKDKDIKEADKTKKLEDLKKDHEKASKRLNDRVNSAEIANRQSAYLDRYFMMFGFLLVMGGSLLFMMPDQPHVKRVVGAIVITAQMVLVFIAFLARSVSVS